MCHLPGQMLLLQFCTAGEQEQVSPEARRGKRAELNSAKKTTCRQKQELETELWIGGKRCKHWQLIFWGYRCISWFRRFCTARVKKKKKKRHSSVKEQNILLLLSNESSTFQKGNFSKFRNFVFQESGTRSTPAGRCFHPKCLAVSCASVRAEPITASFTGKTENIHWKWNKIQQNNCSTAMSLQSQAPVQKVSLGGLTDQSLSSWFSGFGRQMFTWTNIGWTAQDDRNSTREFSSWTAFPFKSSTKTESFPRFSCS